MAAPQVHRLTLFKIPNAAEQDKLLARYAEMPLKARKNGEPYIRSVRAGKTFDDQRRQGHTVTVVTLLASEEEFHYYDQECEAHKDLKTVASTVHEGNLMLFFESTI